MAREVRPDPRLRSPARVITPIALVLCVAAGLAIPWWPAAKAVSLAFALVFVLALLWMGLPMLLYRCPTCRMRLRRPTYRTPKPDDGSPIHFYCPQCDIEWDTGWLAGGSGDE